MKLYIYASEAIYVISNEKGEIKLSLKVRENIRPAMRYVKENNNARLYEMPLPEKGKKCTMKGYNEIITTSEVKDFIYV